MNLTTYTLPSVNRRSTTPKIENNNRRPYSLPVDAAFPFTESSDAQHFRPISTETPSYFDFGRKIKSRGNVDSTDQISTNFRRRGYQRPIGEAVTPKLSLGSTAESIISRKRICNRLRRPFKGALPSSCGNSEVEIPSEINITSSLPPPSTFAAISEVQTSFKPSAEIQKMTESSAFDNNNNNDNSAATDIINFAPNVFENFAEQQKSTNDPRIIYHRNAPVGGKFRKMSANLAELLNSKSSKSPEIFTYTTTEGTLRTEREKSVTSVSESELSSTIELTTYANLISSRHAKSSSISFDYDSTSTVPTPTILPVESFDQSTTNFLNDSANNTKIEITTTLPEGSIKIGFKSPADSQNFESSFHIITYTLTALGIIPLVVGMVLIAKMLLHRNKKEIFEGSEYSSEYNRSPLDMNGGGITSSPIATTKLPRISRLINHWEKEKKCYSVLSLQNNNNWEIPRSKLRLQTILGQGNFGQVWKAEAEDIGGHEGVTRLVAVKMVKEGSSYRERDDLVKEMAIMQHLGNHSNVVTMLACCTDKEPFMLVMEYVMYGKLLTLLRDRRTRSHYSNFSNSGDILTSRDLTAFAYGIARGMEFITSKQVIHKDLAARNILLDRNKICKIADFGMSRYVGEAGSIQEHKQNKGALPIRWMAPESLHCNTYSYKTDVWSFGILMWEIVTLGSMPYASMGARIVMRKVKDGYRLEKPKHCHATLFAVISQCWHADPNKRPNFSQLKQLINQLLEDSEYRGCMVDLDAMVDEMADAIRSKERI